VAYHVSVKEWHHSDQPRERLAQNGAESLGNAELLAILLRVGMRGMDVVQLSQGILTSFGGLVGLSHASLSELAQVKGVGPVKAVTISAALELGKRLLVMQAGDQLQIRSPQDVATMLELSMGRLEKEELRVVMLNTKNRMVAQPLTVYRGSLNTSMIRVAEVFRDAIKENCASIIVVHNHPSGDPTPSPEDIRVTREIVEAGKLLDIEVLDHLIIGRNRHVSLRQQKLGFDKG